MESLKSHAESLEREGSGRLCKLCEHNKFDGYVAESSSGGRTSTAAFSVRRDFISECIAGPEILALYVV